MAEKRILQLNDKTYAIILPAPTKCMPLCNKVATLLGPLLGCLKEQADKSGWQKFAAALANVDADVVQSLFMKAVEDAHLCVEGQPISSQLAFDTHFDQYRSEVYHVCAWVLWECVRDFFPELGPLAQMAKEAAVKGFQSPTGGK